MRTFLILFILTNSVSYGQVKFPNKPIIKVVNDTTYQELTESFFYSYFSQQFDSVFISFEPVLFYQKVAINIKTHQGYFSIYYGTQLLIHYEIRENQIEGIGIRYHPNLLGKTHRIPYCQSMFKRGKLDGVTSFYDSEGKITEILLFKNGKYKKHLYHQFAQNNDALKEGNKKTKDPFKNY